MGKKRSTKSKPESSKVETNRAAALDIGSTLAGKNVLLIGSTGFVGKVAMCMLLDRYPEIGKIIALVRPGMGNTAEDRFFKKVATSPAFDPLRTRYGDGFHDYLTEKVLPIQGDIGRALCNFTDEDFAMFDTMGGLDVIINSAGLVSFTPSLESAIRINAKGARNCVELAKKTNAALVHISTCYVAGRRSGDVWEDENPVGYFPRSKELVDDDFDADAEIADCDRVIERTQELAKDRRHISMFRERAQQSLREQRRDPNDKASLRLAVARERKLWVHENLTKVGMKRAEHWGWSNTYTYSKSLGEQVVLQDKEVRSCIVRPAIVESSFEFPIPGWNEGFNTTAPLVYVMLKGQRLVTTGDNTKLDIIPVDMVCSVIVMATAAVLRNEHKAVYHAGSSGVNPVSSSRLCELSGLSVRGYHRQLSEETTGVEKWKNLLNSRREAYPVSRETFDRWSSPRTKRLVNRLSKAIDERLPRWGAPRLGAIAERVQDELAKISTIDNTVIGLMDLFAPFIYEYDIAFRSDNVKDLWGRLTERDKDRLMWVPEKINWRTYWCGTHFEGLQEYVFPVLDDEFGAKPRTVYTHKDLIEFINAAVTLNRHRVALRLLQTEQPDVPPIVYTYERLGTLSGQVGGRLQERSISVEDRVALMSEGTPEWSIAYFGILKAGATAVPLDSTLSMREILNLLRASEAKVFIVSDKVCERLADDAEDDVPPGEEREFVCGTLRDSLPNVQVTEFDDIMAEPTTPLTDVPRNGNRVASLIFTSGTTGQPKGVMLTHKNLTSMTSKLSATFRIYKHDGLLSVLPMHHTFEFSAGLLMPLMHGSSINYLNEITADSLSEGFKCGHITGIVGVPALWQLLNRKVRKRINERGPVVEKIFDTMLDLNRKLREATPLEFDLGRLMFFPVHREFGGRVRMMISGGSALSPDVMKSFRGMGFDLLEGYGMTEASPVLAVQRPGEPFVEGSVGKALTGVSVKIFDPNDTGVGEIVAKGPNIMKGYYENDSATSEVIREGWLHTGDLGRIDENGHIFIVGRKKEMILGTSGENVYPDELEEIYFESDTIKEISIVGLPSAGGGEVVAALVVPDYEFDDDLPRHKVRELVREHMQKTSKGLPQYKRVKICHLWDYDLPRTSTRKIKRNEVRDELERLEKSAKSAIVARDAHARGDGNPETGDTRWVRDVVAQVSQRKRLEVRPESRMDDLGFDSLMITELTVALESAGLRLDNPAVLADMQTVGDVEMLAAQNGTSRDREIAGKALVSAKELTTGKDIVVPGVVADVGRAALARGQTMLYTRYLNTKVSGKASIPPFGGFIVAANHSSHLDMGLVKHSLGELGDKLVALAAKDYFFEDPIRKAYFENFTNLVPMERHGSLRESLRVAGEVLREGYILLIFPEGTRSTNGIMTDFKPSLGYLAMSNRCGILPMYLGGTYDAMPKGAYMPARQEVVANVGMYQSYDLLTKMTKNLKRAESYRYIAYRMEEQVRAMAPRKYEWTLGDAGRNPVLAETAFFPAGRSGG